MSRQTIADEVQTADANDREVARKVTVRAPSAIERDPSARRRYLTTALAAIPRLLGSIDRHPHHATYGCFDRQYWHYRTSPFPSEMYQEGVLPLALIWATSLPGNRWHGVARIRELAVAALRFSARNAHADASCDDYYPFERALGAAVFSLQAAARAYQLLEIDDREICDFLARRGDWVAKHDESGHLSNHHALAALGLARVGEVTGNSVFPHAARRRVEQVLAWQSHEGWFEEYGGADAGYQTVTIDCLAKLRAMWRTSDFDEPLSRAVRFARLCLHADGSIGGEYGSRGTHHFYPHGFELLARENSNAADMADTFLGSLATGRAAAIDDDRLYVHRLANLIEAYLDWSPRRASSDLDDDDVNGTAADTTTTTTWLSQAGLLFHHGRHTSTIVSAWRGGVVKHVDGLGRRAWPRTDAGLVLEADGGRVAVSQAFDTARQVSFERHPHGSGALIVSGNLTWARHETATPLKQAIFHLGMVFVGRWSRTLVRKLLQRRLITGRRMATVRFTRRVELLDPSAEVERPRVRIVDRIELLDRAMKVARMSYGVDHQSAYVAACGVYQEATLEPWTDLSAYVDELNDQRVVDITREW